MKILLVDDDEGTRKTLSFALCAEGADVTTAESGLEALQLLKKRRFDWLVTDGMLPAMTGFDLAEKACARQPGLRAVMITGVFEPGDNPGPPLERVFIKPVEAEELMFYMRSQAAAAPPLA